MENSRQTVSLCSHIKITGHKCGSPALSGKHLCYFHSRATQIPSSASSSKLASLAVLEDKHSIQFAFSNVYRYLLSANPDYRRAAMIIRLLKAAAANAREVNFALGSDCMVVEAPELASPAETSTPSRKQDAAASPVTENGIQNEAGRAKQQDKPVVAHATNGSHGNSRSVSDLLGAEPPRSSAAPQQSASLS